jgi:hypothetical protein
MRRVILESPFAGDVQRNLRYARACVRDSLLRGEAPIASHLLYTQPGVLNDDIPAERQNGIDAGLAWCEVADASVVYVDLGISSGMKYGMDLARKAGLPVEVRTLPSDVLAQVEAGSSPFPRTRASCSGSFSCVTLKPNLPSGCAVAHKPPSYTNEALAVARRLRQGNPVR